MCDPKYKRYHLKRKAEGVLIRSFQVYKDCVPAIKEAIKKIHEEYKKSLNQEEPATI